MPINNKPTIKPIIISGIFPRFIAKTIPLAFDESMSYYECLCALLEYINKTVMPDLNNANAGLEELQNLYMELQNYVNTYFDNLDIQEEINNKLDEMAQSGELNEYIKKLDYFIVDNTFTQDEIQQLMNLENAKIIEFKDGDYNFDSTFVLNKDTTLLLNNANLIFSVTHGFFNFKSDDEFLEYNGNGNIKIIGGTINAGISFIHGEDLTFKNINFYHVLNDHAFELCSLKNVYIENCTFEGIAVQTNDRDYVEIIQIDDCTRENFPWLTENNPTYDGTPNYNINIEKCIFKKPNIITYALYTAIGGHTYIENKIHKYINIKNNEFYETEHMAIRLNNVENCVIDNNKFEKTISTVPSPIDLEWYRKNSAIEFNWEASNIIISNNNSNYARFLFMNTRCSNVTINNNFLHDVENITNNQDNMEDRAIICIHPSSNTKIENNIFENIYCRIIDSRPRPVMTDNDVIIFKNNIIRCSTNTTFDNSPFAYYGVKHLYLEDNIFDINPTNTFVPFARLSTDLESIYYKNNITYKATDNIDLNEYTNTLKNVYDNLFITLDRNDPSITNYEIADYNIFDFNRVYLTCGTGNNTQNFVFKPFFLQDRLTARTYKTNAVDNSGNACIITFTINNDGTISYSSSSSLNIRQVVLYNE